MSFVFHFLQVTATKTKITINLYGIDAAAAILAADFPWVGPIFDFSLGGNVFCIILMFVG